MWLQERVRCPSHGDKRARPTRARYGYSGSAVFCDGYLVGVVKSYPVNFGGKSLRVEPIAPLLEEPGFKEGIFGTSETNVSVFPIRSNAPAKVDSRREREYLDTLIED